ncbi:MAG: DUF1269 domain-containing protein [Oligoflexales bacterium]
MNSLFRFSSIVFLTMSSILSAAEAPRSILVGVYNTTTGAEKAYKDLEELKKAKVIGIDAFAIVEKDKEGRVTVRNTQQRNAGWGAVAGGIIGTLAMGPVGGLVAGAGTGGLIGWLTGERVGISRENIDNIRSALEPNSSAVVTIVEDKWITDIEKVLRRAETRAYIKDTLEEQKDEGAAAH